jgi:hypothetical protein
MYARFVVLSSSLFMLGCGPFVMIPGGALSGTVAEAPTDWSFSDEVTTIQLETRPEDPYSVNIWAVGMGTYFYVHAGANRSTWVEHLEADGQVRVRIDKAVYELQATRVVDTGEFQRFCDAYEAKYDRRPRNENVEEAYVFKLAGR